MYIIKKLFKWLIILPIIYLIGILSLFVFGTVLVISDNTKWIWPGKVLVSLSNFYRFLSTIENW
jgi:hypothetical protein